MSEPRTTPKTALKALIEAHALELKLPTVKSAERRERRRLIDARFPQIKCLEEFRFADNPKIPQATIAALAEGTWINDRESIILGGDSGTGKTHLATALAVCACQQDDASDSPRSPGSRTSCRKQRASASSRKS